MDRREYCGVSKLLWWTRIIVSGAIAALIGALPFMPTPSPKAGVLCSLPFTLTNGTTADATQVMANYNAIITCLGNAAAAGVNTDINALNGLTTPIPPSEGGTSTYVATATSTGAANAQVVATTTPSNFTLSLGKTVVFVAGFTNTGATTLNVAGTGATNLFRITPNGVVSMAGGEITVGQVVAATFDGTQFQMTSKMTNDVPPGTLIDWPTAVSSCPIGYTEATGGNITNGIFPALAAILSNTWGSPGGGLTTLPDVRGRTTFGRDSGGSGRITVAGGNFDGTTVGNTGGQQNQTLTQAQLPNVNFTGTASAQTIQCNSNTCQGVDTTQTSGAVTTGGTTSVFAVAKYSSISAASSVATVASGGSGNPHPVLSNAAIVQKCIKE